MPCIKVMIVYEEMKVTSVHGIWINWEIFDPSTDCDTFPHFAWLLYCWLHDGLAQGAGKENKKHLMYVEKRVRDNE